jgi:hypothetical protein
MSMRRTKILPFPGTRPTSAPDRIDELVRIICEVSIDETQGRLGDDASKMTAAELRGYIRARAFETVSRHTHEIATLQRLDPQQLDELFSRALERTVVLVARQTCQSASARAARHSPLRLAG